MTYRARFVRTSIAIALVALAAPLTVNAERAHRPARILVKGVPGLDDARLAKILERHQARAERRVGRGNLKMVEVPQGQERAIAKMLAAHPNVAFAEVDELCEPIATVDDPDYGRQWHLPLMGAPDAWSQSDGEGVVVAVCDTGVNANHPDLVGQTVPGKNVADYPFSDNTSDVHGHGTKVSGVVAARANNTLGVASVAPGARVMTMRITNDTAGYAYFSDMAECVDWAADNGARVANISYGGVPGSKSVADAASRMMAKGGLVVVAAGNDGKDMGYAVYDSLYVAGATTSADAKASYSNYGAYVDVAAPGSSIYTTTREGGYASVSGTSFASPNTAATAALVMAANPSLNPSDVMSVIGKTAVDLGTAGDDPLFGAGRIDALAAVQEAAVSTSLDSSAPTASFTNPRSGTTVRDALSVEISASDNVGVAQVDLLVNGAVVESETLPVSPGVYAFAWDSKSVSDGTHTLSAVAVDAAGNRGSAQPIDVIVANSVDTTAPTVTISSPTNGSTVSGSVSMAASATDDVAVDKLSLYLNGNLKCEGTTSASCSASLSGLSGTQTVSATAVDKAGNFATTSVQFKVGTSTKKVRISRTSTTSRSWFSSWFGD